MTLFSRLFTWSDHSVGRSTVRIVEPHSGNGGEQIPLLRFPFRRFPSQSKSGFGAFMNSDRRSDCGSVEASQGRVSIFYNVNGVAMFLRVGDCFYRETKRGTTEIAAVRRFKKLGQLGFHVEFQKKIAVQKFVLTSQTEFKTLALDVFMNTYRSRYS